MNELAMQTFLDGLEDILVPLGICVILPVTIVWMSIRKRINDTNKRTQIILTAIEKNPDVDIQEYLNKLNRPEKSLKEKLMQKLLWACVLVALGVCAIGYGAIGYLTGEGDMDFVGIGSVLLMLGIAFLIVFFVSKKTMAKELKAENKNIEQ